jgi:phospho-N-acetylmuramoyl-pentapeptide-transferase
VIIAAALIAYAAAHLLTWRGPTMSAVLVLFLMSGLGFVGFLDDYIKISRQRSLGLRAVPKLVGQSIVSIAFAVLVLQFPNAQFRTPASTQVSFIRDTRFDLAFAGTVLGVILFIGWAYLITAAASNGVNLTDGLDGLATGASTLVFAAYILIGTWQSNQSCQTLSIDTDSSTALKCYEVRDPRDLAVVAACVMGAASGSCGGTPRRPRSSWATPARWLSAGRSPGSR